MRLKFVLMNVATGDWQTFSTSSLISRNDAEQERIIKLKERTYQKAVTEIRAKFMDKST